MSITVGIDTGGTFTDLVAVDDESGRWHVAKVPSNPDNPVAAIDASLGAAGFDPADVELRRRRHDDRHQRGAHPPRRARRLPHDRGLPGRPAHPAHQPQAPLRLPLAQADPARAPARLPRRRRAHGRGRARARPDRPRGARRRRSRRSSASGEDLPAVAVCFLFSYLNPEHELAARDAARAALPGARRSRSRTRSRRSGASTSAARRSRWTPTSSRSSSATWTASPTALEGKGTGGHWALLKSNGGHALARRGARPAGAPPALGHRGRGHRRRLRGARGGSARGDRARHGRHELRRLPDRRRRAALLLGLRDRVRPAGERAERLDAHDRRGRRLDRLGRPRRLPPGRPAERGRRARPGRATARAARARRSPTPTSCSAGSTRPSSSAASFRSIPSARARCSTRWAASSGWTASRRPRPWCASATRTWRTRSASSRSRRGSTRASSRSIAFGGAGATHACEIAEAIGMRRVSCRRARASSRPSARWPRSCAWMPCAASTSPIARPPPASSTRCSRELEAQAQADVAAQGLAQQPDGAPLHRDALPGPELRAGGRRAGRGRSTTRRSREVYAEYGRLYEGFYGYRLDGIPIELVRLSVVAMGEPPVFAGLPSEDAEGEGPARRDVFFPETGFVSHRHRAPRAPRRRATRARGPLIVESMDSTVVVPPGWALSVAADAASSTSHAHDRSRHPRRHQQQPREHLPRDGHHDDPHGLLADLQRGPRLLVRAVRPARQHDRPGGVLPGADRGQPVHRALDARGARHRVVRARRRRAAQRPLPRRRAHPRALP